MQPIRKEEREFCDLQASLDAYFSEQLNFDELRTQWILTLAENPEICSDAIRLLYQQPSNQTLTDDRALALKRVIEASFRGGPDDATVVLEASATTEPVRRVATTQAGKTHVRPPRELRPGQILKERFVLEEQLGRGGVGIVFRALDRLRGPAGDGRGKIAVKVLRDEYQANSTLRAALQREALQVQALSHPNIVRVHDFHEDSETRFLTMELVEGELLSAVFSRLRPAALPRGRAMRIIAAMCHGLGYAHERGLVHADFKPGNVILAAGDVPKILDFGLAHAATTEGGPEIVSSTGKATKPLQAVTLAYSSCNRLKGGTPEFSDDVYSLSCVIYELLAGRHPYDRKTALVARALNLQPKQINGLTELQWRTLAAGLRPSREDRAAEVNDLQEAFNTTSPLRALKVPAAQNKRGERASSSSVVRFLFAVTLVSAAAMLFFQFAPAKYVDPIRDSEPIQKLQSTLFDRANESVVIAQQLSPQSFADVEIRPDTVTAAPVSPLPLAEEPTEDVNDRVAESDNDHDLINAEAQPVLPEELTPAGLSTKARAFELDAAEYFIPESGTALAVQITRQGDVSSAASVEWRTIADSAEPGADYANLGRRLLHFAAGEENKTIFIPIVSDAFVERNEYFRIALRQPGDNTGLAQPYAAIVTIIDDD